MWEDFLLQITDIKNDRILVIVLHESCSSFSFERKESSRKGLSDLFLENKIYHIKLAISRDYPCAKNKWHVSHHGEMSIKFNRCEEKLETGSLRRRIIPKFVDHNNTRRKQGNKSYSRVYR